MSHPLMGGDPDAAVKVAHATLYRSGEARAYGGGLLVLGGRVLTCAHVVNQALGRSTFEQQPPPARDGAVDGLLVALPGGAPGQRFRVAVEQWLPGRREDAADVEWSDDLALLRLVDPLPKEPASPPFGHPRTGPSAYAWYGSGNATTVAAVVVQGSTDRWLVLDTPGSAQELVEGYSGTPLWDRERRRVVGLVVSRLGRRAFAIPTSVIAGHFPWLAPETGQQQASHAPAWHQLTDLVRPVLGEPGDRAACARELARELETAPPAHDDPSPEWLVLLALSVPHGVATLMALLAERATTTEQRLALQTQSVFLAPDELLTAAEHRRLLALLAEHPTAPQTVVARALPLGPIPAEAGWPEVVRILEEYRPRHGKVPNLLRVVEFAARSLDDPRAVSALQAWNDEVAGRLGLTAGLAEHRAQAAETARRADRPEFEPPLVQLQLWRSGRTERFGCTVRAQREGGVVLYRSFHDQPVALPVLLELLREVLALVAREADPGVLPRLEIFVQKDELDLPVDQWVYRSDEYFPSVLGQDFVVVLRCPELRRPEYWPELRYRWQARHTGTVLAQEKREPVVQERGRPSPVSGVALCGPPSATTALRAIAMAVGVPGVVWPRAGAGPQAGAWLRGLTVGLTVAQLPRAVYEARIADTDHGVHLALIYDGPDGIPATLPLSDPQ